MQNPPVSGELDATQAPNNVVSVDFASARANVKESNPKMRLFEELLESGIVMVGFDPRVQSTLVPPRFRMLSDLRLNFSYAYQINDFGFDDEGIRATLMFPEGHYFCFVPWIGVFSVHSEHLQRGSFWPESAPREVRIEIEAELAPAPVVPTPKPRLTLVRDE